MVSLIAFSDQEKLGPWTKGLSAKTLLVPTLHRRAASSSDRVESNDMELARLLGAGPRLRQNPVARAKKAAREVSELQREVERKNEMKRVEEWARSQIPSGRSSPAPPRNIDTQSRGLEVHYKDPKRQSLPIHSSIDRPRQDVPEVALPDPLGDANFGAFMAGPYMVPSVSPRPWMRPKIKPAPKDFDADLTGLVGASTGKGFGGKFKLGRKGASSPIPPSIPPRNKAENKVLSIVLDIRPQPLSTATSTSPSQSVASIAFRVPFDTGADSDCDTTDTASMSRRRSRSFGQSDTDSILTATRRRISNSHNTQRRRSTSLDHAPCSRWSGPAASVNLPVWATSGPLDSYDIFPDFNSRPSSSSLTLGGGSISSSAQKIKEKYLDGNRSVSIDPASSDESPSLSPSLSFFSFSASPVTPLDHHSSFTALSSRSVTPVSPASRLPSLTIFPSAKSGIEIVVDDDDKLASFWDDDDDLLDDEGGSEWCGDRSVEAYTNALFEEKKNKTPVPAHARNDSEATLVTPASGKSFATSSSCTVVDTRSMRHSITPFTLKYSPIDEVDLPTASTFVDGRFTANQRELSPFTLKYSYAEDIDATPRRTTRPLPQLPHRPALSPIKFEYAAAKSLEAVSPLSPSLLPLPRLSHTTGPSPLSSRANTPCSPVPEVADCALYYADEAAQDLTGSRKVNFAGAKAAIRRRERRQGWSGVWDQGNVQGAIDQLRNM